MKPETRIWSFNADLCALCDIMYIMYIMYFVYYVLNYVYYVFMNKLYIAKSLLRNCELRLQRVLELRLYLEQLLHSCDHFIRLAVYLVSHPLSP